ncbi:phage tail protein [Fulvimonas soli]|jgi:microcystin-dependent protein|uniref:Microcystin-dependent protein n=1 Tax=Fulvimonas soli TaxID=155197 RepID=A0A316I0R2_9GAMM|nr:tail fiber protein [Fulvimonas soli]PWK85925.1 microcystin-dependent protein [Fulvimonas soli]TNY26981.1 microcystin-dependent protein [Fulvimonas soli]
MSQPFLGQIMPVAFNFAPKYFALCNGQLLPINQNQALFSLLGTYYGGNGTTNFALPDLRSRTPVGSSNGTNVGEAGGVENVTLLTGQIPAHSHTFNANTAAGTSRIPGSGVLGAPGSLKIYGSSGGSQVPLNVLDNAGQTLPHPNLQPYTVLNFCIALQGLFPSRN